MMKIPTIFRQTDVKSKILRNREAVLDIMADKIKGARQCPLMMGQKCIGEFCEHFMEFQTVDNRTGERKSFFRCAHVQLPLLIIELIGALRQKGKSDATTP